MANRSRTAWVAADVLLEGDQSRSRVAWSGVEVLSPLEERARAGWAAVDVLMAGDQNLARVAFLGVEVLMDPEDPPVATAPEPAECRCGPGTWLLDLDVGGRVFRYSTREQTIRDARGNAYLYRAGLTDFDREISEAAADRQGIEIVDRRVPWPALRGSLVSGRALLRHAIEGEVLEQAIYVLDGLVDEPEVGDPEKPAALVGSIEVLDIDRSWPDPRAVVSRLTWDPTAPDDLDSDVVGAVYPTVFGYPGHGGTITGDAAGTTPALLVFRTTAVLGFSMFVIADGVVDAVGGTVRLYAADSQNNSITGLSGVDDVDVFTTTDLLGREVSVVEVPTTGGDIVAELGQEYYVGWQRGALQGGGAILPDRSGPIRHLTDVMLFVGRNGGRAFDFQAQESQRAALEGLHIDGCLTELDMRLVPWFEQTLLPLFPLARVRTRRGIYWRHINYGASPVDAVAILNADEGRARRATSIRTPTDSVKNRFTLHFGFTMRSGEYTSRRTLAAEAEAPLPWFQTPSLVEDERVVGSPVLARSTDAFRLREADLVETKFVWAAGTAAAILEYWARRDAFPRSRVTYSWDAREARQLEPGDVVCVTDSEAGFDADVGIVKAVWLGSGVLAGVVLEIMDRRVRG